MKIRPLVIDAALKAEAAKVVAYAREHFYIMGKTEPPGRDFRHVLETQFGYRCVFSFTVVGGTFYRDLSVSVPEKGKFPNQFAFYTIAAELFGFTGWDGFTIDPPPEDWVIAKDVEVDAIRVGQRIEPLS